MKLNTGIIANSLPFQPQFVCGRPDHALVLSDIRALLPECAFYSHDILYYAEWAVLEHMAGDLPPYLVCIGGGKSADDFFKSRGITGIILEAQNPVMISGIIQSVFLHYNQLECRLLKSLLLKETTQEILNCCSEFFQNHTILFDSGLNLIDYSTTFPPDENDPFWKVTLLTKKRSEIMFNQARKMNLLQNPIGSPSSEMLDLGAEFPRNMINSFYDSNKRIASIVILENNKPVSACQLKLLDYISDLIAPFLSERYSTLQASLDNMRAIFVTILNKLNVDPAVVRRCLGQKNWHTQDDYRLILIYLPENLRNPDTLTRSLYIYEDIFPECIVIKFIDRLVLIVHNDTEEIMNECMPKLEKQLDLHNAVCGVSFPFNSIYQINSQYNNADMAVQSGDKNKRVRYLKDIITNDLVNKIASDTPLIPLCHRGAMRVYDYDRENGTDLLLTLETYLRQNKSQKAAAEELFVHRSTLTYRLGCIEKLTKINYDDSKDRLHLLLSCIVLRNLGHQHLTP